MFIFDAAFVVAVAVAAAAVAAAAVAAATAAAAVAAAAAAATTASRKKSYAKSMIVEVSRKQSFCFENKNVEINQEKKLCVGEIGFV